MKPTFSVPYKNYERLCRERKITSYKVSKDTGISSATFSSWKYGDYIPKLEKLIVLCDYFGVELEYFIERKNKKK